jgi:segregation and condensation protein A
VDVKKESVYIFKYGDIFQGPAGLLLELVRNKRLDICDISISYIIRGFLDFLKDKKNTALETISGFVYFSSLLLEIKSRSLLPSRKNEEDVNTGMDINILRRREKEYRTYRRVSNYISSIIAEESLYFIREGQIEKDLFDSMTDFMDEIDPIQLWVTAGKMFLRTSMDFDIAEVYNNRAILNIFSEMDRIKEVLKIRSNVTFKEISSFHVNILDKIISFLSILELYKNEEIEITQFETFGNIIIKKSYE